MHIERARSLPPIYLFLCVVLIDVSVTENVTTKYEHGLTRKAFANDPFLRSRNPRHLDTLYNSIAYAHPAALMDSPESRTIAAAICKAHCLKDCADNIRQKAVTNPTIAEVFKALASVPNQLRSECVRLSPGLLHYEECDQACETDRPYTECIVMCETGDSPGGWSCLTGCRALDAALKERPGACPPQGGLAIHRLPDLNGASFKSTQGNSQQEPNSGTSASGERVDPPRSRTLLTDSHKCTLDAECLHKHEKCCHSQCKRAVFREDILPPLPNLQILETKSPPSFLLSWERGLDRTKSNLSDPTVYVLQVKTYFGQEFDNQQASPWKTLLMSTLTGAQLSEPRVGWWYQFQVAAVNRWGSLSFENPSPPVQLSNPKPQPPSPPRDLADRAFTVQADGEIRVQIQWNAPTVVSIPVTEYRIYWGLDDPQLPEDPDFSEKTTEFVHTVPATETSVELTNLLPDSLYRIQVMAMSDWGSTRLHSLPSNLFVRTPPTEHLRQRQPTNTHIFDPDAALELSTSQAGTASREENAHTLSYEKCICDGKTKSSIVSRPSGGGSGRPRFQFQTDPAFFDGKDIRVHATLTDHMSLEEDYAKQGVHGSRSVEMRWIPQVCIETDQPDVSRFLRLQTESSQPSAPTTDPKAQVLLQPGATIIQLHPVTLNQTTHVLRGEGHLTGLRLNCRYVVEVSGTSRANHAQATDPRVELRACLCTPSCTELQTNAWLPRLVCEQKEPQLIQLAKPRELNQRLVSKQPLTYNISWLPGHAETSAKLQESAQADGPVTGSKSSERRSWPPTRTESTGQNTAIKYRIVWGPSRDKPISSHLWRYWPGLRPRLDPTRAETKVLSHGETSIVIGPLLPQTQYVIKLQAISTDPHLLNQANLHTGVRSAAPQSTHSDLTDLMPLLVTSKDAFLYFETPGFRSESETGASSNQMWSTQQRVTSNSASHRSTTYFWGLVLWISFAYFTIHHRPPLLPDLG